MRQHNHVSKKVTSVQMWWRIGTVFIAITLASLVVFHGANAVFGPAYDRLAHSARAVTFFILVVPMVVLVTRLWDKTSLPAIGLTPIRQGWRQLLMGMACWLIPAAIGFSVVVTLGWTDVHLRHSIADMLLTAAQLVLLVFIFEALPEELVFRGYLLSNLTTRYGAWPAIWTQAALFTLWGAINGGDNSIQRSLLFFAFAVVVGLLRVVTASVWTSVGFHLAFQTVAQLFGEVGGQFDLASPATLTVFAFGVIPFATSISICQWIQRNRATQDLKTKYTPEPVTNKEPNLTLKGINYDVGTCYVPNILSRPDWESECVREDIRVIAEELHCNAVAVFGSETDRLIEAARYVLDQGMQVWIQPRLVNNDAQQSLATLKEVSITAEQLRQQYPGAVVMNVGCELSIFMSGIVPGRGFASRTAVITATWPLLLGYYNKKLNSYLRKAATVARTHFHGDISYSAGSWENIDWALFDLVGVNLYRDAGNQARYITELRALQRYGKPVVITEFGCCTYDSADARGASGENIVQWNARRPRLKRLYTRSESVQAQYLTELIDLYAGENVHGAFVFEFAEPSYPHSTDPRYDLDMASYGIVKVLPEHVTLWERKAAFTAIADRYQAL